MSTDATQPIRTLEERLARSTDRSGPCWIWIGAKRDGYGRLTWAGKRFQSAHRLAWEAVHGPIPAGLLVCHTCDVRACVRPEHLFLGTPGDNARDRERKGRGHDRRGSRNGNARLSVQDVRSIRVALDLGVSQGALARRHAVKQATIWEIAHKKTWVGV